MATPATRLPAAGPGEMVRPPLSQDAPTAEVTHGTIDRRTIDWDSMNNWSTSVIATARYPPSRCTPDDPGRHGELPGAPAHGREAASGPCRPAPSSLSEWSGRDDHQTAEAAGRAAVSRSLRPSGPEAAAEDPPGWYQPRKKRRAPRRAPEEEEQTNSARRCIGKSQMEERP